MMLGFLRPKPKAKPESYQGSARYPIRHICLHTSDTRKTWMTNQSFADRVVEIRRWHVKHRGWKDIGYHWVIDRNGAIMAGRAESVIGAGVMGFNNGVIHICLLGGFGGKKYDHFATNYTPEQERTLTQLIGEIGQRAQIQTLTGHNDHAARECPCFTVRTWVDSRGGLASLLAGNGR